MSFSVFYFQTFSTWETNLCVITNIAAQDDKIIWDQQVSCEIQDSHGSNYRNIVFCDILSSWEMSINQNISYSLLPHNPSTFDFVFWIFYHFPYSKHLFIHTHIQRDSQTAWCYDKVLCTRRKKNSIWTYVHTFFCMPHFTTAPTGWSGLAYIIWSPPKNPPFSCLKIMLLKIQSTMTVLLCE